MPDWRARARALASRLQQSGVITDSEWHAAVRTIPRHELVPSFYGVQDKRGALSTEIIDAASHLDVVYGTETLITSIAVNKYGSVVPVSSSTKPDLMLRMLEDLNIASGHRVLEIGTGTGYNAALLAHRLGQDNVYSIDVAADLVQLAAERLNRIGYRPHLAARDGTEGWPENAPYDRIIATCSVSSIPAAWSDQLTADGIILVDYRPRGGNIIKLHRAGRLLEGRFRPYYGAFMVMHHSGATAPNTDPSEGTWQPTVTDEPHTRITTASPDIPSTVGFIRATIFGTPLRRSTAFDRDGRPSGIRLTAPDGSWCEITNKAHAAGMYLAREAGPTPILTQFEQAITRWLADGSPGWDRLGVTIDPAAGGSTVTWIDSPAQPLVTRRATDG